MSWVGIDRPYDASNPPMDYLIVPPTRIAAEYMILIGAAKNPTNTGKSLLPVFEGVRPDSPDECYMVFETAGVDQGRHMIGGGRIYKYGFNIQYRTMDYENSSPIRQLARDMQAKPGLTALGLPLTLDSNVVSLGHVVIQNIESVSGPIHIGIEKEAGGRHLFSLNILMALDIFTGS